MKRVLPYLIVSAGITLTMVGIQILLGKRP